MFGVVIDEVVITYGRTLILFITLGQELLNKTIHTAFGHEQHVITATAAMMAFKSYKMIKSEYLEMKYFVSEDLKFIFYCFIFCTQESYTLTYFG